MRFQTPNSSIWESAIISSNATLVLCIGLLVRTTGAFAADNQARELSLARESLLRAYPGAAEVRAFTLRLTADEKQLLKASGNTGTPGDSVVILLPLKKDSVLGYSVLDNVRGKDQLITYLVVLDTGLVIRDVDILMYRESYGGEVANTIWRKQFQGKRPGDRLRPGREIRNITGATISVRAITGGVQRVLAALQIVKHRIPKL